MINHIKLVLFDLDGVLVDSKKNMEISWSAVQKNFGIKVPFKNYFKNVGLPFKEILKKNFIKKNLNEIEITYNKESICNFDKIKLYPGVNKTLKDLKRRRITLGIVTSKNRSRTIKLIKKFKMNIKLVVPYSRKLRGKPFPNQLLKAMQMAKINKVNTLYVADMLVDYKAAKNAKISFLYTKYGYGKKYIFYKHCIKKITDLPKII